MISRAVTGTRANAGVSAVKRLHDRGAASDDVAQHVIELFTVYRELAGDRCSRTNECPQRA